jgi:YD repeat-containing protein
VRPPLLPVAFAPDRSRLLGVVLLLGVTACSRRPTPSIPPGGAECVASSTQIAFDDLLTRITYDYDAAGRMVRAQWEYLEPDIERRGAIRTFEYDDAGRLARDTLDQDLDGRPDVIVSHHYDPAGRLESRETVYPPAPPRTETGFEYDDAGRRTRNVWANGSTESLSYAPDGRARTSVSKDVKGVVYAQAREELDERGHLLRAFRVNGGRETLVTEKTYGVGGRLETETTFDDGGKADRATTYEYDERGNLVGDQIAHGGRPSLHTSYTYRGAWRGGRCGELPTDEERGSKD